jgi:hypothetical protein
MIPMLKLGVSISSSATQEVLANIPNKTLELISK